MFHIKVEVPPIEIRMHQRRHQHDNDDIMHLLAEISLQIEDLKGIIMSALSDLQTAVTAQHTVLDSAVTLMQGLKAALDTAGTDQAALTALSADIDAKTRTMADALVANTPAANP